MLLILRKPSTWLCPRKSASHIADFPPLFIITYPASFKYLGVLISSNLSWSPHINWICSKIRKLSAFISHTFYWHVSPNTLLKLYKSLLLPHLCYSCSVWEPPWGSVDDTLFERTQMEVLSVLPFYHLLIYKPFLFVISISV